MSGSGKRAREEDAGATVGVGVGILMWRGGRGEVRASKSAWARPRGREGGWMRRRLGVEKGRGDGVMGWREWSVGWLGRSVSRVDDLRRFLETRGGEAVGRVRWEEWRAGCIAMGLWSRGRGCALGRRRARGGVEMDGRGEVDGDARRDWRARQVVWTCAVPPAGEVGVRGGERSRG